MPLLHFLLIPKHVGVCVCVCVVACGSIVDLLLFSLNFAGRRLFRSPSIGALGQLSLDAVSVCVYLAGLVFFQVQHFL